MSSDDIAAAVLECIGGFSNVEGDSLCATRLRISLKQVDIVDRTALQSINGVLGIADRGSNGIEVVFGPNLVRGVFSAFQQLVGPKDRTHDDVQGFASGSRASNFQVSITPEIPGLPNQQQSQPYEAEAPHTTDLEILDDVDDTAALLGLLSDPNAFDDDDTLSDGLDDTPPMKVSAIDFEADGMSSQHDGHRLMVVNGPNVNLLGLRETEPYGTDSFTDLLMLCHESARKAGFVECECYQSNHEGDLIDWVQDTYELFDAIVINPGVYGHTSIALLEALLEIAIPTIEVHIGQPELYLELAGPSLIERACLDVIKGKGIAGYREAIFELAAHLGIDSNESA